MEFEQYMTEGVRKAGNRSITFSNDVGLYVGHEFDIEMTRCVSKLEMPSSCHPVFQPASHLESEVELEEDEDASLLAVHAAHLRDFEHVDINMDPALTRELHDQDDPEDLDEPYTDTESSYEPFIVDRPTKARPLALDHDFCHQHGCSRQSLGLGRLPFDATPALQQQYK